MIPEDKIHETKEVIVPGKYRTQKRSSYQPGTDQREDYSPEDPERFGSIYPGGMFNFNRYIFEESP